MPFVKPAHRPLEEDKLLLEEDELLLLEEELPSIELEDASPPAELDDGSPAEPEDGVSSSLSLAQEKNVNDVAIIIAVTGMDK